MHMHMFFVFHIVGALVLSFFVLFAASKAEGLVSLFGNILGVLLLLLAILGVVGAVMMHGEGDKGREWMEHMHGWGPQGMMHEESAPPPAAQPAPAQQTAPAEPKH